MIKTLYTLLAAVLLAVGAQAQNDTLLFENFNVLWDSVPTDFGEDGVTSFPSGNDTIWVNFDADGKASSGSYNNFIWDTYFRIQDSLKQGGVIQSNSWMANAADQNLNWIITPPIYLPDALGKLSWKSAPWQGPRYIDGYKVIISTTTNDPTASPVAFTDTVFKAAEMTAITGSSTSLLLTDFTFSEGYIHANGFTDTTYFIHGDSVGNDIHYPLLEPHEISLAAYAGKTIYIGFLHDAFDDYLLAFDDIMVTGTKIPVNTRPAGLDAQLAIFPNPATTFIRLTYTLETAGDLIAEIIDMQGRVLHVEAISGNAGSHHKELTVNHLPAGAYSVVLTQNGSRTVKTFVKR